MARFAVPAFIGCREYVLKKTLLAAPVLRTVVRLGYFVLTVVIVLPRPACVMFVTKSGNRNGDLIVMMMGNNRMGQYQHIGEH